MSSSAADSVLYKKSNSICTDVAIIGNGPSAICLSYFLSGHRPYYNGLPHSNPYLSSKLKELGEQDSIVEQDLEYLCEGVEGRSSNPVAVLFDALCHPDADMGGDNASLLDWRLEKDHAIRHVVLGKNKAGGAWQNMDGSMQTLSLSSWMELPSMPFMQWFNKNRRSDDSVERLSNRATITDVCEYYTQFVKERNLSENFLEYHTVTSIQKVYQTKRCVTVDDESGESEPCCCNMKKHPFIWEVRGFKVTKSNYGDGECDGQEIQREEFIVCAPKVVIATGTFDIPNKLSVPGEQLPHIVHSLHEFESVINNASLSDRTDPVLIIGAGLSAADAILMATQNGVPVIHVFRKGANDSSLVLKKLPKNMYPEYHQVHSMMKGATKTPLYKPYAKYEVVEFCDDKKKVLLKPENNDSAILSVDISSAAILIGARPDLSFLPQDSKELGIVRNFPIESKSNPIDIDPFSYQAVNEPGLYALGPLVGDNFVRFAVGGALGVTNHLLRKDKL